MIMSFCKKKKKKKFKLVLFWLHLVFFFVSYIYSCHWHLVSCLPLVCPSCPLQSSPLYPGCLDPPPPWNKHKQVYCQINYHKHLNMHTYSQTLLSWTWEKLPDIPGFEMYRLKEVETSSSLWHEHGIWDNDTTPISFKS